MAAGYGVRLASCCAVNQPILMVLGLFCAAAIWGRPVTEAAKIKKARRSILSHSLRYDRVGPAQPQTPQLSQATVYSSGIATSLVINAGAPSCEMMSALGQKSAAFGVHWKAKAFRA